MSGSLLRNLGIEVRDSLERLLRRDSKFFGVLSDSKQKKGGYTWFHMVPHSLRLSSGSDLHGLDRIWFFHANIKKIVKIYLKKQHIKKKKKTFKKTNTLKKQTH